MFSQFSTRRFARMPGGHTDLPLMASAATPAALVNRMVGAA
jgi:hypothetical protein